MTISKQDLKANIITEEVSIITMHLHNPRSSAGVASEIFKFFFRKNFKFFYPMLPLRNVSQIIYINVRHRWPNAGQFGWHFLGATKVKILKFFQKYKNKYNHFFEKLEIFLHNEVHCPILSIKHPPAALWTFYKQNWSWEPLER